MSSRKGFTLIELLIVIGVMAVIGAIALANLLGARNDANLSATTQQVATLLRQAQSDAVAQEGNVAWGVYFLNTTNTTPFYALFSGAGYSATTTVGRYLLPTGVSYQTSTLASGASLTIIFSPITGAASTSTSIGFSMPGASSAFSSTIFVASSGEVSY